MAVPAALVDQFQKITQLNFAEQAKWFLNAFWTRGAEPDKELIWSLAKKMTSFTKKGAAGTDLDELEAHKFIEALGETLTVIELRERLRKIDLNNDNKMAMIEYLLFRFPYLGDNTVVACIEAPQADNSAELAAAAKMVEVAEARMTEAIDGAAHAKVKQAEADKQAQEAEQARQEAEHAEQENKKAMDELNAQEKAFDDKKAELEGLAGTPGVKGGQAAAELLKLKNENPLPLRKAQAEQAASVKKAEKANAKATATANAAKESASAAHAAAEAADASAAAAEKAFADAQFELSELKRKPGCSNGSIWFMERDIEESQKFMPKKKQH
jgi:chemotaxis protein histidine kinase CheA